MFNIQGSELIFLLLIALVILGPEKLPDAVRRFGRTYSEFKKFSAGFQGELRQALDEPLRELRETADAVRVAADFDFDAEDKADEAARDASGASDASSPTAGTSEIRPRQKSKRDTALNFGDAASRRGSGRTEEGSTADSPADTEATAAAADPGEEATE